MVVGGDRQGPQAPVVVVGEGGGGRAAVVAVVAVVLLARRLNGWRWMRQSINVAVIKY